MPEARREEIASILETLFYGEMHSSTGRDDRQLENLRRRVENPGPIATDEQTDAFFARFKV